MNKIFQIGFNSCGTNSFYELFNNYCQPVTNSILWNKGYLAKNIHDNIISGKKPLHGYEAYSIYCGMECFEIDNDGKTNWIFIGKNYFDALDIHYPDSKFILNTRNIDNWITEEMMTVCNFSEIKFGYTEKLSGKIPYIQYHKKIHETNDINQIIDIWKNEWKTYHENVINHFMFRPTDLLIYDIEQDPFSKIVDFFTPCGLTFTTNQLPTTDKTKDFT